LLLFDRDSFRGFAYDLKIVQYRIAGSLVRREPSPSMPLVQLATFSAAETMSSQ